MRFGFLSTYPPTQCGLATFTQSLATALAEDGDSVFIVRSVEPGEAGTAIDSVTGELVRGDVATQARASAALNAADAVIVQHEYGIYGGPDGDEVLAVLGGVHAPVIVVLHTVLSTPTASQKRVLEDVCRCADAVVVMSAAARDLLAQHFAVPQAKVHLIPHGASLEADAGGSYQPGRILTWGLIGPGKGIEWGIRAMPALSRRVPTAHYVIAGQTHPKVRARQGEEYRDGLRTLAAQLGVPDRVTFDDTYRSRGELPGLVSQAQVVLLPYDSDQQVTSGVLIEAVAAGRPVVATDFPHAREMLGGGAGIVVPHRNPQAIAEALEALLDSPARYKAAIAQARDLSTQLQWTAIAQDYRQLAHRLSSTDRIGAGES